MLNKKILIELTTSEMRTTRCFWFNSDHFVTPVGYVVDDES